MKSNKNIQLSSVANKSIITSHENDDLPEGWYQGLIPDSAANGKESKSATFKRFAALLIEGDESISLLQTIYSIASLGWNLSFLPAHLRVRNLAELLCEVPVGQQLNMKDMLSSLIERKETFFADYQWTIGSFHLEPKGNGVVLSVAALRFTLPEDSTINVKE